MGRFGNFSQILKSFLIKPSEKNFNILFNHLMAFTHAHLLSLKSRGRQLPDEYSDPKSKIRCLALDIITSLICKKNKPRYSKIFNIYKTQNITDFEKHDEHDLFNIFVPAFRKLINQNISALRKEFSPQQENMRRQIGRAIDQSCCEIKIEGDSSSPIGFASFQDDPRLDKPTIPHELLHNIVLEAFNSDNCTTVPKWLDNIFNELNLFTEYQNVVDKYLLISTCIKINSAFMQTEEFAPTPMSGVDNSSIRNAVVKAQTETVESLTSTEIQRYCDKNTISESERELILNALDNYLTDFAYDGTHDKFPTYFRELFEISSKAYQAEYKNIIDTVFTKARKIFKEKLKNDPTIKRFGRYYIDM